MPVPALRDVGRSTLYLLASLPLGTAYFALVVGGAAAGVSLLVFVVGVVVLAATAAAARKVAAFDAALAARLFDLPEPSLRAPQTSGGILSTALAELRSPSGYRAAAYLLARFGVGLVGFTAVVGWLALSVGLLGAPLYYDQPGVTVGVTGVWEASTLERALVASGAGALVAVLGAVLVAPAGRAAARVSAYVLDSPWSDAL